MRAWAFRLSEKGKKGELDGEMARKGEAYWLRRKPTLSSK
jgi:hypothetical protein